MEWTQRSWGSLLAGVFLCSIPYFLMHSVSQYSDIVMAFFLLASVLMMMCFMKDPRRSQAVWVGLLLGLMSFTKDEGILASWILLFLITVYLNRSGFRRLAWPLFGTYLLIACATVMVKIWTLTAARGVNQIDLLHFFQWPRWIFILRYFLKVFMKISYGGIFIIPIMMMLWRSHNIFDRYAKLIVWFLIIFISTFFLLYVVVKNDLGWRLWTTSYRLIYQILPLSVFLLFYCVFKKKE
jgi:hypothetical protein